MSLRDHTTPRFVTGTARLPAAVAGISVLALFARLFALGTRVAHWDEGRVAYWILKYMETGDWHYRPIIHGPFLQQVNPGVFALLGANDFTMRLVVALLGGMLPLSAWLFREHLRDSEVVALALLLAANPVVLYYSRFMRSDLPLAAFMLLALGFYVRTYDTRDAGYLYVGTGMLALAFTTKESVLVYLLCWLGAGVLLLDHRLFRARDDGRAWPADLVRRGRRIARGAWAWRFPLLIALVEFFAIVIFFYAPRPELWEAFSQPATFPDVIGDATLGSWDAFTGQWVDGAGDRDEGYLSFAKDFWETILYAAAPLVALAAVGFVADRYSRTGPRDLVSFAGYWGVAMAIGYPLITDIKAPWGPVHVVVPLAVPAAVGLALLYRWGRDALAADDRVGVGLTVVVLLVLGGQIAATAHHTSFVDPVSEENKLVQYVQPPGELRDTIRLIERVSEPDGETDVLFYGEQYGDNWHGRLPLPWYLERYDAETQEVQSADGLPESFPPVVITGPDDEDQGVLDERLPGYESHVHGMAYSSKKIVVYVDRDRVPDPAAQ